MEANALRTNNRVIFKTNIVIWMVRAPPGSPRGGPSAHFVAVRRHAACQITIQILKFNRNRILNARGHTQNRTQTQNSTVLRNPIVIWMVRASPGGPRGGPSAHFVAVRRHAACQITVQIVKLNRNRILNARGHTSETHANPK